MGMDHYGGLGKPVHVRTVTADEEVDGGIESETPQAFFESHYNAILANPGLASITYSCFLDGFEYQYGYKYRTGLYHVDFADPQRRRIKRVVADLLTSYIG